ncbi:Oidioi.mRNA.OKI2018_I69.XSR.g14505.t1.cds [Oikopleura dioica]|uniref:Oidioi.mRNA.OKI2018_I69.XSR.g14505.t1.cds n=1 Tax=Oikopleura dioica TaxID=34765 RepID=A0ABN7SA37_OIKDI|nr:Oidioi.mRNA.OKI2018_I69.XSR.g14505.t1.cds [Oikopleura dioica]
MHIGEIISAINLVISFCFLVFGAMVLTCLDELERGQNLNMWCKDTDETTGVVLILAGMGCLAIYVYISGAEEMITQYINKGPASKLYKV